MLCSEVQGLQEEGSQLGLTGGELFLLHHPDVLSQDAHERAHVILPQTAKRGTTFIPRTREFLERKLKTFQYHLFLLQSPVPK